MLISESNLRKLIREFIINEGPSWDSFRYQTDMMNKDKPLSTDSVKVRSIIRNQIISDVINLTSSYVGQSYNQRSGNIDFRDPKKNWHCQMSEVRFKFKDRKKAKSIQKEIFENYKKVYKDYVNADISKMIEEKLYNGGKNSDSLTASALLNKLSRFEAFARMSKDIIFVTTKSKKKVDEGKINDLVKQSLLSRLNLMFGKIQNDLFIHWYFASEDRKHDESKRRVDAYSPDHFYEKEDFLKMRQVYDSAVMICREYFGGTEEDYSREITDDDYGLDDYESEKQEGNNAKLYNKDDYLNYLDEIIDEDLSEDGKEEIRLKVLEIFPNGFEEAIRKAKENYIKFSLESEIEKLNNSYFKNIITEEDINSDHESLLFVSGLRKDPNVKLPRVRNPKRSKRGMRLSHIENPDSVYSYYFINVFRGDDRQFKNLIDKVCERFEDSNE